MSATAPDDNGAKLAENVVHFARVLRRAGMPIGPAKVLDALHALQVVGVERRNDFYYALSTVLVDRHDQQMIFDQAFDLFWRDPSRVQQSQQLSDLLSGVRTPGAKESPVAPRVAEAMHPNTQRRTPSESPTPEISFDASLTMSRREVLHAKDFAAMTPDELAETCRLIATMRMPLPVIPSRRARAVLQGNRVDLRGTMSRMIKAADGFVEWRYRTPRLRPATLVILCDISGSMDSYTRMLLHFIHAVSNSGSRVHTFLFGTRLSNITRALRDRDVDVALSQVTRQVADWAGGTRIGACLREFNREWARRLLGQGAVVLLITDGLDSDDADELGDEMERLSLSCRQLIWLNPLLRYAGFEARPGGIRAMLPHTDLFLPVHNLNSLASLGAVLNAAARRQSSSGCRTPYFAGDRHGNVQDSNRAGLAGARLGGTQ
ncbi:MAG TPA: VWA domain-containing protein [Noviherbaspirillum sp.]|uniref:vWA domain-containing protein n=1 Tax=Noviherbaspirillum sp. TaxID=1926288 RepID=UPI002B48E4D4|nr:VWA domain-containing protein [Noviherbaspirillum sp.]HJV86973.1 VWA domain-containing protein [Noviherbaspirillum sp.]